MTASDAIVMFERSTTKWSESMFLGAESKSEAVPMEVDRVKGDGKGKGKFDSKGKGKSFGKNDKGYGKNGHVNGSKIAKENQKEKDTHKMVKMESLKEKEKENKMVEAKESRRASVGRAEAITMSVAVDTRANKFNK